MTVTSPISVRLKVASETRLGSNVNSVYRKHKALIEEIKIRIASEVEIDVVHREKKITRTNPYIQIGINADSVNVAIRSLLVPIRDIHFETAVEYGAFFERKRKSAFDFSFYNKEENFCKFWNYNRTNIAFEEIINQCIKDDDKAEWDAFREKYVPQLGNSVEYDGEGEENIIGEIQLGNWGLIYKDMFRLLRAKKSPGVNLYIYITDTGFLKKKLSEAIVTYDKAVKEFQEYMDLIDVPVLIWGIDIDEPDIEVFKEAHKKVLEEEKRLKEEKRLTELEQKND